MVTNILPLRIGEFVRAAVFAKKTNRSIVEVVATIATERVFDLIALGLIAVTVVPFLPVEGFLMVVQDKVQESCSLQDGTLNFTKNGLLYLCGGGVVALLGGFLLFCKFGRGFLAWFAQRMDLKDSKFVSFANSFFDGLDTPIKNKSLIKVILISVVTCVAICLANYAVLFAFPVGETNLGQVAGLAGAVFFELVICAAIAMPSVPGFVGVWQVAAKLAFIPYGEGVPGMDDGVLAFALVFHIFMYALTIIVGAHSAYNQRVSWNMIQNLLKGKSDDAGKE
ncbi:MAG: flippase-like domain-containing protein [Candidatus Lindowbacteria bacterium]|nr:flippase-like domain-containing protein [Candidatus Lindowbacteria bacterium]